MDEEPLINLKRWITLRGLAALLAAALLTTFAFTGPEPVSTQDIGAIDHYMNRSLRPATFVPGVPREEVVRKALESAGRANRRPGHVYPGN